MLYHKGTKPFISIFFIFFLASHLPCFSMMTGSDEEGTPSIPVVRKDKEKKDLDSDEEIQEVHEGSPLLTVQAIKSPSTIDPRKASLNRLLQTQGDLFKTALVIYPSDYQFLAKVQADEYDHSQISLDVLHDFDQTFFDDSYVPRKAIRCCGPCGLDTTKWILGIVGAGAISLTMGPFSNGDLGDLFNYPVNGTVSNIVFATAVTLNAPPAFIIFYNIGKGTLQKIRSSFKPPMTSLEGEGNCHFARVFKKSRGHKLTEYLLIPAAFVYGMQPALAFILEEQFFPAYGLPMSVPLLIYYADPFYRIGKKIIRGLYANNFYLGGHHTKETRRAFVTALNDIKKAVEKDKKGTLTQKIWDLIRDQNVSALSVLLSKALSIDDSVEEPYAPHYNRTVVTAPIKEKTRGEKMADFLATFLVGAAALPGYMTEAYLVSQTLSLIPNVSSSVSEGVGYGLSGLFQTRLPLEREMHQQNFVSLSHPFTPENKDHIGIRRAFGVKSCFYSLFGGLLFSTFTYQSLEGVPSPLREIMTAIAAIRYFSYFFYVGSYEYNKVVTNTGKRFKTNPGVENKKAQIFAYITYAKNVIKYELTDESVAEISLAVYNTQ